MDQKPVPDDVVSWYCIEAAVSPPENAPKCPQMLERPEYRNGPMSRCLFPKTRESLGLGNGVLCTLKGRCPVQAIMQDVTGEELPVAPMRVRHHPCV